MKTLLIILAIVAVIVLLYILIKYKKQRVEYLNLITGGIGCGKSSVGVCRIVSLLRKIYFLNFKKMKNDYIVLSSIPLGKLSKNGKYRYLKVFHKKIKCYDLTLDILTLQKRLPQDEVILYIDEFSSIASQFDYNNPIIKDNIDEFFRLFRHYTNGKGYIFTIDQCSQNIFLQCRRRSNYTYNMISCHKLLQIFPIMIYEYRKIPISDEIVSQESIVDFTEESEIKKSAYFVNPFKYYDSYCYSDRYKSVDSIETLNFRSNSKRSDILYLRDKKKLYYSTLVNDGISKDDYLSKK